MAIKVPAIFKKPIPAAQFEKNIIRYIEQGSDQEFLRAVFMQKQAKKERGKYVLLPEDAQAGKSAVDATAEKTSAEDSAGASAGIKTQTVVAVFVLKADLDKKEALRLKMLAKAIKENRVWPVKALPLAICAASVAGAIFFFTVLMNPLLERALEGALENLFEARSDVDKLRLNLLRFRISIDSITVANKERPMQNLFQLSRIEFRLLPQAVLRGKIYIEEIRADGIRFGTARKTSGALARFAAGGADGQKKPSKPAEPPLVDISKFDAAALLDRETGKMRSFAIYNDAISLFSNTEEKWKGRVDSAQKRVLELESAAKPFLELNLAGMDVKNPETVVRLLKLVEDAKTAYNAVQNARNEVNTIVEGINSDVKTAIELKKSAETAVSDDIERLKSYVDFKEGGYHQILDPVLREILSGTALQYIEYGKTALAALEKIKAYQAMLPKKSEKPKEARFKGRDVQFPTPQYPFFYLGILATDITIEGWNGSFDLRNVSSEPDLINAPVTLALRVGEEGGARRLASFDGRAELRASKNELFYASLDAQNFPVKLDAGIKELGVNGFSGSAAFNVSASGARSGAWDAGAGVNVREPQINTDEGIIAGAIDEAVREAGIIELNANFAHSEAKDDFSLNTNIGELIIKAIKKTAAAYINKAIAAVEKELKNRLTPYLEKVNMGQKELDSLSAAARGDKTALDTLSKTLNEKIAGMERKAKSAAEEKTNAAIEDAKERASNAANDALKGFLRR
ncbi:MAG: hypothetical protein Pg6A_14900 [Termitinemataceae bacterium]|nr:MAG: hypothetical protein Pg6A_14900 [Termitinemataceae bacterium]